jgi:ribosomal-protein-alanine N-acetyltransferase
MANVGWLEPWEATQPEPPTRPTSYAQMLRMVGREARAGRMLPLAVLYEGRFVGQATVSGIQWGSLRSGQIGYWVDHRVAGRGIIPTAVALVTDHCLLALGLHRIEVNIRPENAASLRVVEKLGFRAEGLRERYLHIAGTWCDHLTFALTVEDVPGGLLARWRGSTTPAPTSTRRWVSNRRITNSHLFRGEDDTPSRDSHQSQESQR